MKIGITGCAGMLGSHLTELLLSEGHQVIGIDNLDVGSEKNIETFNSNTSFDFYKFDVREKSLVSSVFIGCDVIVHLAAVKRFLSTKPLF